MISIPMRVANTTVALPVEKSESAVSLPARPGVGYYFQPRAVYPGPYVITPTINEQTFVTKDKAMSENLTINPFLWDWKGSTVEKLDLDYSAEYALEDTDYATWTPATSVAVIKATSNVKTFTGVFTDYEYVLHWKFCFTAAYASGATLKAMPIRECQDHWQYICRRPNSKATLDSGDFVAQGCFTLYSAPLLVYYDTTGAQKYTYATTYGIYSTVQAAAFSSSTNASTTVTIKAPTCSARCNSSYFALARAPELDQEKSKFKWTFEAFRVPIGGVGRVAYNNLVDAYRNGL